MDLRDWRRAAGVTQQELAREACVSRGLVSQGETGRIQPSAAFAGRVARALSKLLNSSVNTWDIFPEQFRKPPLPGSLN